MAKKKGAKKAPPRKKPTKTEQQAQQQMQAVLLFAVGILLGFLTYIEGTKIWRSLHLFLFGLLGWSSYFVAPLVIYIAVLAATNKPEKQIKGKLWQSGMLLLFISGAIEVFGGLPSGDGFFQILLALFKDGINKEGGGMLGIIFAGPLSLIGTFPIPQILILLGLFVFIMLVTGSTLMTLYYKIVNPVKQVGDVYSQKMVEREAAELERQQKKLQQSQEFRFTSDPEESGTATIPALPMEKTQRNKFNIDIDISDDASPEEFETATPPLEPITKDLSGAYLRDPLEQPLDTEGNLKSTGELPLDSATASFSPIDIPIDDTPYVPPELRKPEPEPAQGEEHPLANFGVDFPVEYITLEERQQREPHPEPEAEVERRHPLEEDIALAQEEDILRVVEEYLREEDPDPTESYEETEDIEPIEIETFRADITQPLPPIGKIEMEYSPPELVKTPKSATPFPKVEQPFMERVTPSKTPEPAAASKAKGKPEVSPSTADHKVKNGYTLPPLHLLESPEALKGEDVSSQLEENGNKLVATLKSFGVETKIINITQGPAVTRYELQPSPGVKISRITGLADDIALNLATAGIRIEAPIPNKAAVGIEVPNSTVRMVRIRELIDSKAFQQSQANVAIALGKDISGNATIADISKMPHLLIAGATGSGKSVCINTIIISILYKYTPDEVKLLMIDPKVVELGVYNGIPHLLVPVVTDPKKAAGALSWAVAEMLKRYKLFADTGVRDITGYNRQTERDPALERMPQIVVVIDELADLMMASPTEVEDSICRLAQMARAAGMHLVIATQRPSVDVITGVIKANIPSRIAFSVSSQVDSRTILDMGGAEKLLGRGDMLFYPSGAAKPVRIQGCLVSDQEVEDVVDFVKKDKGADYDEGIADEIDRLSTPEQSGGPGGGFAEEDELIPYAIETVVEAGQASTSLLQRRLKVGYARAARMVDQMEERGLIGPFDGSRPRDLLITKDDYIQMKLAGLDQPNAGGTLPQQQTLEEFPKETSPSADLETEEQEDSAIE